MLPIDRDCLKARFHKLSKRIELIQGLKEVRILVLADDLHAVEHFLEEKFELLDVVLLVGLENVQTEYSINFLEESHIGWISQSREEILEGLK